MEIERKFIANINFTKDLIQKNNLIGKEIEQYYVKIGEEEERYRSKAGIFYHTIKRGKGLAREEYEKVVSELEFNENKKRMIGNLIQKTRYEMGYNNLTLEIDMYLGVLEGLCMCEVEFPSVEEAKLFVAPKICVQDVTDDKTYKNQSLAFMENEKEL